MSTLTKDLDALQRLAKFPSGVSMTVEDVAAVVGPEFKEMNENPPPSVIKVRDEMTGNKKEAGKKRPVLSLLQSMEVALKKMKSKPSKYELENIQGLGVDVIHNNMTSRRDKKRAEEIIEQAVYLAKKHKVGAKDAMSILAEMDMNMTEGSIPKVKLGRDLTAVEELGRLAAIDRSASKQVAEIILRQLGGGRTLKMVNATNISYSSDVPGVSFKFMNSTKPSKTGNHVKITLDEGKDLYDMEFGYVRGFKYKVIKKLRGVFAGDLMRTFRDQANLNVRMSSLQLATLIAVAKGDEKAAKGDEKDAKFDKGKPADPTENMSEEDAKKWRLENLQNKDKFTEKKAGNRSWARLFRANSYLNMYFSEADIPYTTFKVKDSQGLTHDIPNGVVVEHMAKTRGSERKKIEDIIRKIDFANGNVNHFLKHLAGAIAEGYSGSLRNASLSLQQIGGYKEAAENAAGFDEGSRVPDGWDPGHVESDPQQGQAEGSEVPDGEGNLTKRAATSTILVGIKGQFHYSWPMVFAHGKAEIMLGRNANISFDHSPQGPGEHDAWILTPTMWQEANAIIFTWVSDGMPAGMIVLKADRRAVNEARAEMNSGSKRARLLDLRSQRTAAKAKRKLVGKAQTILGGVVEKWPAGHSEQLASATRGKDPSIHFAKWMKAAEVLAKKGYIKWDGSALTKI